MYNPICAVTYEAPELGEDYALNPFYSEFARAWVAEASYCGPVSLWRASDSCWIVPGTLNYENMDSETGVSK